MSRDIEQLVEAVAQAIDDLNKAFEEQISEVRQAQDVDQLKRWVNAAQAMQDSGHIYLTWAKHYAGLAGPENEDDPAFLDEGSPIVN